MAPQIFTNQLNLSQPGPGGTYYAHNITTVPPGFSDLPTALIHTAKQMQCRLSSSADLFSNLLKMDASCHLSRAVKN